MEPTGLGAHGAGGAGGTTTALQRSCHLGKDKLIERWIREIDKNGMCFFWSCPDLFLEISPSSSKKEDNDKLFFCSINVM